MTLNLLKCIDDNSDKNQKGCSSEELRELLLHIEQTCKSRHYCNECNKQGAGECYTRHNGLDIFCCILPGRMPGIKPLLRFISSAI